MQKTKQQLKSESVGRFKLQLEATRKDIKSLDNKLEELQHEEIEEATPEVINVLEGMRRDITFGSDNIKRIRRVINGKA